MQRFTLLSHEGVALPEGAPFSDVGAIRHAATGLLIAPFLANDGKTADHARAQKAAALVTLFGEQCRLPEVEELFALMDRSKYDPAIDTDIFPFLKEAATWRMWSNTACAWNEADAWSVDLGNGNSYVYGRASKGLVLAVRGPVSAPGQ